MNDQYDRTAALEAREAMLLYIQQQAAKDGYSQAIAWATRYGHRHIVTVMSLATARYEDVRTDVQRGRLLPEEAKAIVEKMVELRVVDSVHADIWMDRMLSRAAEGRKE